MPTTELAITDTPATGGDGASTAELCSLPPRATADIAQDPKSFGECLRRPKDNNWKTYDSVELDFELLGSNNGSVVEIIPSYTTRWRAEKADGSFQPNYVTVRGGIRAPVDSSNKKAATFADLTKFERASGVAAVFGLEWGNGRPQTAQVMAEQINKALGKAQSDCVAARVTAPPSNSFEKEQQLRLHPRSKILELCDRQHLIAWMKEDDDRRGAYYDSIIRPLFADYTKAKNPPPAYYFAGVEGSYSDSTYRFLPLTDPAGTETPVLTELPPDFPGGDHQIKRDLYAFKAYAGRGIGKQKYGETTYFDGGDASVSLTYRRDFTFPKNTDGQQVCAPDDVRILCFKKNIAPPFELRGFVGGARIAGRFPSFSFLPPTSIELRGSYDFAVNRFGIEVPVYIVPNDKGVPHGGLQFSCTSSGETSSGLKLEGDCRAAIFVGSEFKLDNR